MQHSFTKKDLKSYCHLSNMFFFYLSFDFTFATIVCVFCWSLHCKINLKFLELIGCNTCKCTRIIFKSIRYLHALHHFMCAFYLMSNKRLRFDKKKIGAQETILIERRKKKYRRSSSPIEATHCLSFADTYFYISSSKAQKSQNNWIKQVYGWFYWKDQAKRKQ